MNFESDDNFQKPQIRETMRVKEEEMQNLRNKANKLLLGEEWKASVEAYSQIIDLCKTRPESGPESLNKIHKLLCLALCNRAEARSRLRDFSVALWDCDRALEIESNHFKTLLCKGKILLSLNKYSMALDCFKLASLDPQSSDNLETVNGYIDRSKKLLTQLKTGAFDFSDWILSGYCGKLPEIAEYISSPVIIKKSEISGRGLFTTKNVDTGTLILVTKAIAVERGILGKDDLGETAKMVMWKNFVNKVVKTAKICRRTYNLISLLSKGEEEDSLEIPDISLFRPDTTDILNQSNEEFDADMILNMLDVNSLVESTDSSKILGKNKDYYGIGLWVLASFINHSCCPNASRLHVGDYVMVHASRDIKAGEEIKLAYFDTLSPLDKRKEMSKTWGLDCRCSRCSFEESMSSNQELKEIEMSLERGTDVGAAIYKLEEGMRKWGVKGRKRGYLRASFWAAYCEAYSCERLMKRWGNRIPGEETSVDSVVDVVGSDERVVKVLIERLKKQVGNSMEMERVMTLGKGIYGRVVKKQVMRSLLGMHI